MASLYFDNGKDIKSDNAHGALGFWRSLGGPKCFIAVFQIYNVSGS